MTELKYWRSPEQKERTEAYVESLANEFLNDLSDLSKVKRRDMLKLMGASLAVAGVGVSCRRPEEYILPYTTIPEGTIPGIANYFATSFPGDNGAIGLIVESHENRPTKIEGNPDHPASLGKTGFREQAAVLELYDPDRSRFVTHRDKGVSFPASFGEWDSFADDHFKNLATKAGEGLVLITNGDESPTFLRLLTDFKKRFPKANIVAHNHLKLDGLEEGSALAFGEGVRFHPDVAKAKVILSVGSDFLMTGPDHLRNARGFAENRRPNSAKEAQQMSRLYVVEAQFTVTGANADHRLRVSAVDQGDFLKALADEIFMLSSLEGERAGVRGALENRNSQMFPRSPSPNSLPQGEREFIKALAKDLKKNRGKALVLVGNDQPAEIQALGHLINIELGGFNNTFRLTKNKSLKPFASGMNALSDLIKSMSKGAINTLIMLDVNPVYTAPGAMEFAEALKNVPATIHLGLYENESGKASVWHLPMAHFLESFSDAKSYDGTVSVIQPLIAPLFGGKASIEILAQLAGSKDKNGLQLVKSTFQMDEKTWRKTLHDGLVGGSSTKFEASFVLNSKGIQDKIRVHSTKSPTKDAFELLFVNDYRVGDGRFGNLGWLQELPDPITKLTWGNALLVGPQFARNHNIESRVKERSYAADVVEISLAGRSIEVPVFVLPGMPEHSAALSLGYGRKCAGAVGNKVGVDAYSLLPANGARFAVGATLTKTGKIERLASTQEQFAMNGEVVQEVAVLSLQNRDPAREGTVAQYEKDPLYAKKKGLPPSLMHKDEDGNMVPIQMTTPWKYEGNKFGMVIDLSSCIGCNACVTACQAENNIPVVGFEQIMRGRSMQWIRVDRYYTGDVNNPRAVHQPVPCMHCENAPCEPVCPVAATSHDSEGLNVMTYNRCVGTRYCANNCPYKVRRFNYLDFSHSGNLYVDAENRERTQTLQMQANPNVTVRYRGVMEKCTYCTQRIQKAKFLAHKENRDSNDLKEGDVVTACMQACPTDAIKFGNLNDRNSQVARLKKLDRNYDLLPELNTRPRTSYLSSLRNPNPELV